jgi:hypothetical protein
LTITQAEYLLSKTQTYSMFSSSVSRDRRQSLSAKKFPKSLWDQRTVPFTFHKSIGPEAEQLIRQAIAFWAHKTCLNFIEEKAEEKQTHIYGHIWPHMLMEIIPKLFTALPQQCQ